MKTKQKISKRGKRKDRTKNGTFKAGNKAAEKWTQETVLPILEKMWNKLTTDDDGNVPEDKNIVRANDIKLLGEICLMFDVTKQRWNEWEEKFTVQTLKDGTKNKNFSGPVSDLMKKIKWILECRLTYSGTTMDMFVLKAHYEESGFRFAERMDVTSKDKELGSSFLDFLKQTSTTT